MSHISVQQLRELRHRTGAGMLDCRQALEHTSGELEQAVAYLRRQAAAEAMKRAERLTGEGQIGSYIHHDAKVGALTVGWVTSTLAGLAPITPISFSGMPDDSSHR